jgi:hypothetical protein
LNLKTAQLASKLNDWHNHKMIQFFSQICNQLSTSVLPSCARLVSYFSPLIRYFARLLLRGTRVANPLPVFFGGLAISVAALLLPQQVAAQLIAGIEMGTSSYKASERTSSQFLNRESGLLNGTRVFFGAQRNWKTKGWIAELDYKTGSVDYFGLTANAFPVATTGQVRLVHIATTLHWPVSEVDDWGFAVAPRFGYRSQSRSADGNAAIAPFVEKYQEGVFAIGLVVHNEFERGFGIRARLELERSLAPRLGVDYPGLYQSTQLSPQGVWRPILDVSGWYRINPRHSVTVSARLQDFRTGPADSSALVSIAGAPPIIPASNNFPGQKIRVNSLNAGYAFHF